MGSRRLPLILTIALLPALLGCSRSNAPAAPPPLDPAALNVVADKPGVAREQLARAVDALFTAPDLAETRAVIVMKNGQVVESGLTQQIFTQPQQDYTKALIAAALNIEVVNG